MGESKLAMLAWMKLVMSSRMLETSISNLRDQNGTMPTKEDGKLQQATKRLNQSAEDLRHSRSLKKAVTSDALLRNLDRPSMKKLKSPTSHQNGNTTKTCLRSKSITHVILREE